MARKPQGTKFSIDPAHEGLDVYAQDDIHDDYAITLDIWRDKYRWKDEEHPFDSMRRVVEGVYAKDPNKEAKREALEAMQKLLWVPAGRIQSGAGTSNIVTLLNCYVCREIEDSMSGIADALKDTMLTLQQGGGDGMNFSTLRPKGAFLNRTGAIASGPLPFIDMWDTMCHTIMSAGGRRGAQMAVLDCEHPDLIEFITAKQTPNRWTNFNISVLITDAFLDAVKQDEDWFLGFTVPRKDGKHLFVTEKETDDGNIELWYAYTKWSARKLWALIIKNTYEWSEPGVIFIDRINRQNNLNYCEVIIGTNPCGEQPLPADGCCNLGAVNLARMVSDPFSQYAKFDFNLLKQIVSLGIRFLDNVIDVTIYPLEAQAREEIAKRRIGCGITGLANALAQLGVCYGSDEAVEMTGSIMSVLANTTYYTSAVLANERGSFPLYDAELWGNGSSIIQNLEDEARLAIAQYGIRNGVLLTIAPTGTTSLYIGNVSSGLEPTFLFKSQRNVRQRDNTLKPYTVYDYNYRLYELVRGHPFEDDPGNTDFMISHEQLTIDEHLKMQAICQQYIDASVSKTINCPRDITFEEFRQTYEKAYEMGCKGCTTYRYSEMRGAVLLAAKGAAAGPKATPLEETAILVRPDVLTGKTYKLNWPNIEDNYYITINDIGGTPFEMFIQSTSSKYADWATALSLMISAIMRKGGDTSFISRELMKVRSADDAGWVGSKFYGSLVALIGDTIGKHQKSGDIRASQKVSIEVSANTQPIIGEICPHCGQPTVFSREGCDRCDSCDYSRCG